MKGVIFVSHFHDFPGKKKKMPVQWKTALTFPMSFFALERTWFKLYVFFLQLKFAVQVFVCGRICDIWKKFFKDNHKLGE